jgi:hypothetical protein
MERRLKSRNSSPTIKVFGGIKPTTRPFELFPNPNPHQIRAFYFTEQEARNKVENRRNKDVIYNQETRLQHKPYIVSFRRLCTAIQMQPPASKKARSASTVVAK